MLYLDFLPDEIYISIYKIVMNTAIRDDVRCSVRKNFPMYGDKTNSRVVYLWKDNKLLKSLHMSTDGRDLYSYTLKIGTTSDQYKHVLDYTTKGLMFYSVTTSIHVGMAKKC